jgi:hypothetical protein
MKYIDPSVDSPIRVVSGMPLKKSLGGQVKTPRASFKQYRQSKIVVEEHNDLKPWEAAKDDYCSFS